MIVRLLLGILVLADVFPAVLKRCLEDKYHEAGFLLDASRYSEALILYEEVLKEGAAFDDNRKSRIFNSMGYCHYKLDDRDAAIDDYRQSLEIDPNYVLCLNNMAVVLMNQKRYKDALLYLQRADLIQKNIKIL